MQRALIKRFHGKVSIDIIAPYQPQGFGSEAIEWVLEWDFRAAGLHGIGIQGYSCNKRVMKLYERWGFVLEERQRKSLWYHDYLSFSTLKGEWASRRDRS